MNWVSRTPSQVSRNGRIEIGFQRGLNLVDLKGHALLELGSANVAGQPHYFGQWVFEFYRYWRQMFPEQAPKDDEPNPRDGLLDPFYEWLRQELNRPILKSEIETLLARTTDNNTGLIVQKFDTTKHNLTARQRFLEGVKYISNEADRRKYRLKFHVGTLLRGGNLFDTTQLCTVASGLGWAIWVQAPDSSFYSHSHKVARFHHSSFLAGGAVLGAGEWRVSNGRICEFNGKSGHYQPKMKPYWDSVRYCYNMRVCHADCKVRLIARSGLQLRKVPVREFVESPWRVWTEKYITDRNSTEQASPLMAYGNRPPQPTAPVSTSNSQAIPNSYGSDFRSSNSNGPSSFPADQNTYFTG
ncbi:MAG: hypothetical protein KDB03_16230 [Planctomycetales bacterium]|nr:hypothetical protein [Planctomycetales bacterium]